MSHPPTLSLSLLLLSACASASHHDRDAGAPDARLDAGGSEDVQADDGASARADAISDVRADAISDVRADAISELHADAGGDTLPAPSWTVLRVPSTGASGSLDGIACPSPTSCFAVGSYTDASTGFAYTLIESWNGASWSIVPSQNVNVGDVLHSISCPTATSCFAAGTFQTGAGDQTLVETWSGTSWGLVDTPGAADSIWSYEPCGRPIYMPGGTLASIACSSPTSCAAVGSYQDITAPYHSHPLALSYNGTSWTVEPTASPGEGGVLVGSFSAVAWPAGVAVGSYAMPCSPAQTLVESWDGTAWSLVASPNAGIAGTFWNQLSGISCDPSGACTAVGTYQDAASGTGTLVESNVGGAWALVPSADPSATLSTLAGIACPGAACLAVGQDSAGGAGGEPLVETWSGTAWSLSPVPHDPTMSQAFAGLACPSTGSCFAVGSSAPYSSATGPGAPSPFVMQYR